MRKAARVAVWLAIGASLLLDRTLVGMIRDHLISPFDEPYGVVEWLALCGYALFNVFLVWSELRLRPARAVQTLDLN